MSTRKGIYDINHENRTLSLYMSEHYHKSLQSIITDLIHSLMTKDLHCTMSSALKTKSKNRTF